MYTIQYTVCVLLPAEHECESHWSYCRSSSQLVQRIICPEPGHLPHPTNSSLFLRCHEAGDAACVCRCHYSFMCFDRITQQCIFPELYPDNGCRIDSLTNEENSITDKSELPQNTLLNEILKGQKKKQEKSLHHGSPPPLTIDFQRQLYGDRWTLSSDGEILEDDSLFPAWALALLACCGVIIVMLIVLIFYWGVVYVSYSLQPKQGVNDVIRYVLFLPQFAWYIYNVHIPTLIYRVHKLILVEEYVKRFDIIEAAGRLFATVATWSDTLSQL